MRKIVRRESVISTALIGSLAGIPIGLCYELFLRGPMQGNLLLGLFEGAALGPSGAAAAAAAFHACRRFDDGRGTWVLALASGVTVAVAALTMVVFFGYQLGLFDRSTPQRIHMALGAATGMFAAYATLRRILRKTTSHE